MRLSKNLCEPTISDRRLNQRQLEMIPRSASCVKGLGQDSRNSVFGPSLDPPVGHSNRHGADLSDLYDAPPKSSVPHRPPFGPKVPIRPAGRIGTMTVLHDVLRLVLDRYLDDFRQARGLYSEQPDESVHDIRVAARRIRSLLGSFAADLPQGTSIVARRFRRIARSLGLARDLDVMIALFQESPFALEPDTVHVVRVLAEHRAQAEAEVQATVASDRLDRATKSLRRLLGDPNPVHRPASEAIREAIDLAWYKFADHASTLREDSPPEQLHRLRIFGKRLRYLLEGLGVYAELNPLEDVEAIKKVQDRLGRHQDLCVALEWATRVVGDKSPLQNMLAESICEAHARGMATVEKFLARGNPVARQPSAST